MATSPQTEADLQALSRRRMVENQVEARGVRAPRVLEAMRRVPRELFVPTFLQECAHDDRPLLIGYEQTISQPFIVGLMTEKLDLKGTEKVLEVGTGSGYQTAILSQLADQIFTIELIPELSLRAQLGLQKLGCDNVTFRVGDGTQGWPEEAPFDAIIVTAGATRLPEAYLEQLVEGGRLVIPLGPRGEQVLHRYVRHGKESEDERLSNVAFVPLVNGRGAKG